MKNILKKKLSLAIISLGLFALALVVIPSVDLAKTVMTKNPTAEAAAGTCGVSGTDYIFSASTNAKFTGNYCKTGTMQNLDTSYGTYNTGITYGCRVDTTKICYGRKMCRVCSYGSGHPCPWKDLWTSPGDTPGVNDFRVCGGNHVSTYNCNSTIGGCGDAFCGPAAGGNFYNGPEVTAAGRCKPNNEYLKVNNDNTESQYPFTWQCKGPTGHTIGCGARKKVDGVCGASTNVCTAGTFRDLDDTACQYRWTCDGINNGNSSGTCTKDKPSSAGNCGALAGTCTVGTATTPSSGSCSTNWQCSGACGGGNVSCSIPVPPTYSCSIAPQTGISPLVIKVSPSVSCAPSQNKKYGLFFTDNKATVCSSLSSAEGTGTTYTSTPVMWTFPTFGTKKICYRIDPGTGWTTWQDCGSAITVTNPQSSSGGEVAP